MEERKELFYLTTHSTHFIYGYMASHIWYRTIRIEIKETRCRHMGYSFRLVATVLLYPSSHIQDNTYHGLCYTSRGALAGTRNSSTPWRIDPTTHHTMNERSYHGATSRSWSLGGRHNGRRTPINHIDRNRIRPIATWLCVPVVVVRGNLSVWLWMVKTYNIYIRSNPETSVQVVCDNVATSGSCI